jgi:hypothetical protein
MCPLPDQGWPIALYILSYSEHLLQSGNTGKGAFSGPAESLNSACMSTACSFFGGSSGNPACATWWITGPIWDIIDHRWNNQLHRPIYAAGYFLNPRYSFRAQLGEDVTGEVKDGLIDCLERMVPSKSD